MSQPSVLYNEHGHKQISAVKLTADEADELVRLMALYRKKKDKLSPDEQTRFSELVVKNQLTLHLPHSKSDVPRTKTGGTVDESDVPRTKTGGTVDDSDVPAPEVVAAGAIMDGPAGSGERSRKESPSREAPPPLQEVRMPSKHAKWYYVKYVNGKPFQGDLVEWIKRQGYSRYPAAWIRRPDGSYKFRPEECDACQPETGELNAWPGMRCLLGFQEDGEPP